MLPTQETIDRLAERIERSFSLRCSNWYRGCSSPRVWGAAAMILWEACSQDGELPLDPELFVASQPVRPNFSDPWICLAQPLAAERYRRRVRRIIRQLREELRREVVRVEQMMMQHGGGLARFLKLRSPRFSPLGLYITAHRAGRLDVAERLRDEVIEQHRGCPLYRPASRSLLPPEHYPIDDAWSDGAVMAAKSPPAQLAMLN